MKRTNLIDWMFDDGEWLSWTLSLLVPGIIVAVLITHSWVNNSWSFTVNFWGHRFYYENPRREK